MRKPTIRALFVDFGNVCATFDFGRFIKNFSQVTKVSEAKIEMALGEKEEGGKNCGGYSPLFEAFECGEIGPSAFFHALSRALNCAGRTDYQTFAHLWTDIFHEENKDLNKLLYLCDSRVGNTLLSNTNKIINERYISRCAIIRNHFPLREQRILSYEVGVVKPNPLIYKVALARAKVEPEQSLFLDDMPENIEAWRALGGHGIVYHAGNHSIRYLRKELRAFGVLAT